MIDKWPRRLIRNVKSIQTADIDSLTKQIRVQLVGPKTGSMLKTSKDFDNMAVSQASKKQ